MTRFADVAEGVRNQIARYTQALDDGRTDDLIATFCEDATVDIPGLGQYEGRDAIREAYAGWTPTRPQRHLVLNTLVTHWDDDEAEATSDVVFLLLRKSGWSVELVGRYRDSLRREGDEWRFARRAAEFVAPDRE